MVHTWQSHHLPKLDVANLAAGDVVICGERTIQGRIPVGLDEDRVAFAAPLGSRSDLEWLLRGLHLHPNVRNLVVCGDDLHQTGEALLALWREGLGADGSLPGSRGRLSEEIDAACLDSLRRDVEIRDWREESAEAVHRRLAEIPALPPRRGAKPVPDPTIPERKVFLSRKTTFPIFAGCAGDSWLQLLNLAMRIGTEKRTPDGERFAEALNPVVTIGIPLQNEEGESIDERDALADFLEFNREDFERYYRRFEASPAPGEAAPRAGRGTTRDPGPDGVDPLESLCARLKESPETEAGTLIFLGPDDLADAKAAPGLISASFDTVDGRLLGSFVLRNVEIYTDWPLEAMALLRLHREISERVGLEAGAATFVIHAARLHERDWQRAQRVLDASFKRPLPLQVDPSGVFLFGNDGGQARGMLLDHDASTIYWEEAFSDPEDLSWYIVDVMPWLLPQHIRYVGQECASLMRAIREGECYEQG